MKKPSRRTLMQILDTPQVAGYIFILPFIIGFLTFTIIPIGSSLVLSFTQYDVLSVPKFVGLQNFSRMLFQDTKLWKSFGVTFFYAFVSVPLRLIAALIIAMVLVRPSKASSVYRAVYYLPSIMGGSVAVAILWKRVFAVDGLLNILLKAVGLSGDTAWLGRTDTAIWVLIVLAVWQFGSSMLIFLAGLKQIPATLYEAALVDGAGPIKRFLKITLPMLTPTIFFNLVMQMINSFMAFTQSYLVTGGAPLDSTLFYTVYMYRRSFEYYEMGYGCAMAWLILMIVSIITSLIFFTSNKWVFYENKGM